MKHSPAHIHDDTALAKGIQRSRQLPDDALGDLWDSIVLDDKLKSQLLSQAVLNFTLRGKVERTVLPLHGVILLVGQPGTGKTSLARGLSNRVAKSFPGTGFRLLEVEAHSLTSSAMGKTQRAVTELFTQAISEAAAVGPTIVLLDEVEIHRATDAVLVQLDNLADRFPNLLFVATSNFPEAVDRAFTSRCDLVLNIPLPDREACALILGDCLQGLARTFPPIGKLATPTEIARCAAECVGLDGRAIRKMVANALASSPQVAMNPALVSAADLIAAAKAAKISRGTGGPSA
jgi:pachytene checkpoint protein 2